MMIIVNYNKKLIIYCKNLKNQFKINLLIYLKIIKNYSKIKIIKIV